MSIPVSLSEQITEAEKLEISYKSLHPSYTIYNEQTNETIELPFSSITNEYKTYLLACVKSIQLSEKEKENYRYSPKKLSYDLYGTTELWADLLKLNGCVSIAEFEPDFIRVYDPNTFKEYLNEIMIADSKVSY